MNAASAKTQEPSMEEILASIRRIIADDQDSPKADSTPGARLAATQPDESAGLNGATAEIRPDREPARGSLAGIVAAGRPPLDLEIEVPDIAFAGRENSAAPHLEAAVATATGRKHRLVEPPTSGPSRPDGLISHEVTASVGEAFDMLSHTVLTRNARTLEDLVKELLKPMLKTWLDDNLPPLVERLVRAEIERVARGRQ